MRKGPLVATTALAIAFGSSLISPAAADSVVSTRFDMREVDHHVDITVDRGFATLVFTRTVHNSGPKSDQALFYIEPPEGAVATRLRTQGRNALGEVIWFEGDLMEAETAAHKYQELTGIGGYYPKDPALLSWRHQNLLALQVFPVPARSDKTVEYTMKIPLAYENGTYSASLPALGTEGHRARMHVTAAHPEDRVMVSGMTPAPSFVSSQPITISLAPHPSGADARVRGAVANVPIASGKSLVHVAIDAAPQLGRIPASADVAIVIDGSRSMAARFPRARTAARAYLSHFPNANVHVTTFDRQVRAPFGSSVSAQDAITKLYALESPNKNGSRLDDALVEADQWLASQSSGARRVLVLTDLMMRDALTPAVAVKKLARSGAIMHVATLDDGDAQLTRDDDDGWAEVPRKTGGLLYRAQIPDHVDDERTRRVFLEWVRPTRIEKLKVAGAPTGLTIPDELEEGKRLEHFAFEQGYYAQQIDLTGELWSRPITMSWSPTEAENKLWAGLMFGSSLMNELNDAEMMLLATKANVVSPVTSFLAIEPGVRPSTEGLEEGATGIGEGGGGRGEGIGLGSIGTIGHGSGTSFDPNAALRAMLGDALHKCGVRASHAETSLETTFDEIVEIAPVVLSPSDPKSARCTTEKLWEAQVPPSFPGGHNSWGIVTEVP